MNVVRLVEENMPLIWLAATLTVKPEVPPTIVMSVPPTHTEKKMVHVAVSQTGAKVMIHVMMIAQPTVVCVTGTVRPVTDQMLQIVSLASHTHQEQIVTVNLTGVDKTVKYTMVYAHQLVKDVLDQPQLTVLTVVNSPPVVMMELVTV
jgi:hypothetical protein